MLFFTIVPEVDFAIVKSGHGVMKNDGNYCPVVSVSCAGTAGRTEVRVLDVRVTCVCV